ncbi:uncharacterized protein LOC112245342 [Oncorhynchus tshawytscha]|uniref:uncharacterized protein LOC112245342 n=1 Tax=Oncorhynchus tshawytscha TaxID=74940 RepID=UPI000D09869F|nr:uncharacterized protein LOC112245342 [Oncorhynchus tshawytscha]
MSGHLTTCPLDPISSSLLLTISGDHLPFLMSHINSFLTIGCVPSDGQLLPSSRNQHSTPVMSKTTDQYPFFLFLPKHLSVLSMATSLAISLRMIFLTLTSQASRQLTQLRQLSSVREALRSVKDDSLSSVLILIDLSAAFNTMNRPIVLFILSGRDISGSAHCCIAFYLEVCFKQRIFVCTTCSHYWGPSGLTTGGDTSLHTWQTSQLGCRPTTSGSIST